MSNNQTASFTAGTSGTGGAGNKRILERYNAMKLGWLHDSIHFILLVLGLFLLFRYVIGFAVVGGDSMSPTLQDGNLVMYLRIVPEYRPGDIISMRVPAGDYYVKRVVAVGGDVVELADGKVLINGRESEMLNQYDQTFPETATVIYPYLVQEGNVFVLGDHRAVSKDSRAFGEVRLRQIQGKILLSFGRDGIHRPTWSDQTESD